MAIRARAFDGRKALEALLFIVKTAPQPTFHSVSKLFYFADKLHLQRYGKLLSGDNYIAMRLGPVPSRVYDMMKAPAGRAALPDAEQVRDAIAVVDGYNLKALREPDMRLLSEADIECLSDAINNYGRLTMRQLTNISHDEAWHSAGENECISFEAILRSLPNTDEVAEHLAS